MPYIQTDDLNLSPSFIMLDFLICEICSNIVGADEISARLPLLPANCQISH